ncbi:MAG: adenylate/guanylate cyclase domain-containing protein [Deltaproteobacteria bacterium]|nr:adenylate/guanylate cyclase domain-containing protein [Deltaproteobacteria bacterium]
MRHLEAPKKETRNLFFHKNHYAVLANEMLIGNLMANLLGNWMTDLLFRHRSPKTPTGFLTVLGQADFIFALIAVTVIILITLGYERPIRHCLKLILQDQQPAPEMLDTARRRLLNEPYVVIILDATVWTLGSILFWIPGASGAPFIGLACGLITVVLAFFWMEHVSQHRLIKFFFPNGGLSSVPGAYSINIAVRLTGLIFAGVVVPLSFIHLTIHQSRQSQLIGEASPIELLSRLQDNIAAQTVVFLVLALGLTVFIAQNLKKPLAEIIKVLGQIKEGSLEARASIFSNDEIGYTGERLNEMAEGLKEREFIKDTFGRYIDPSIRDEILSGRVSLDGELQQAAILFADLRGFTSLVENTPPKDVVRMLNRYLAEMAAAIQENKGLVFQFIGDEIEAVFGAPVHEPSCNLLAVKAGLAMQQRLMQLNEQLVREGYVVLRHGIGIHSGQVLAASIGSPARQSYTIIGETVNLASRIQSLNKRFNTDILISEAVAESLESRYHLREMPPVQVKGVSEPVKVLTIED